MLREEITIKIAKAYGSAIASVTQNSLNELKAS
jgi:hypothetical protein